MTKTELEYAAQECKDIRGLPPKWYDFDTLAITYGIGHTDAMFISAVSPEVVLGLLDEIKGWKADQKENLKNQRDLQAEINRLRVALALAATQNKT